MTVRVVINAAAVSAEPDEGWMGVSIAENTDGSGWSLHLQCGWAEPDDQDIQLGQDTYCMVDGDGRTQYGGLVEVRADARLLHLRLSPQAAEALDLEDCELELELVLAPQTVQALHEGLHRVLTYGRTDQLPVRVGLRD